MIKILTEWQQERFDEFEEAIHRKKSLFRNGKYRKLGKTYTLNELGFTLQALGYDVYVYTPYKEMEYFAKGFIWTDYNLRGLDKSKTVILFDEVKMNDDMTMEILNICSGHEFPVVGFVKYEDEEFNFKTEKTEYECKWIKD